MPFSRLEIVRRHRNLLAIDSGEPAEHDAEERVPPGRLQERPRVCQQWRDPCFAACRVVAVDERAERIQADVLGQSHAERKLPRADGNGAAGFVKREPEGRSVERVERKSGRSP